MSFLSGLFGGKKSKSNSEPKDTTPQAFKDLRPDVTGAVRSLLGGNLDLASAGSFDPTDTGRFSAPITGQEQTLVNRASTLASGGPLGGQAQDLLGSTLAGNFLSPDSNPFLQATIEAAQRPLLEKFRDVTLPGLFSDFTKAGQIVRAGPGGPEGSSAFARANAIASRGLANSLGDISTKLAGQNFQQERTRQVEAIATQSNLNTADLNNAVAGLQAVALPRLISQFGIDGALKEFNNRIGVVLKALQIAAGLPLANQGQVENKTETTKPNIVGELFGSGGSAAGFSSFFRSSRAFKEDNQAIDHDTILAGIQGLTIDRWRYKSKIDPGQYQHLGPYAEDFTKTFGLGNGVDISVIDALGVALSAIKALAQKVAKLEASQNAA